MMLDFTDEDVELAVKRGVYWLDQNHADWVNKIDLKLLNMQACDRCVIGQAVGDYYETIKREGCAGEAVSSDISTQLLGADWARDQGFQAPLLRDDTGLGTERRYYAKLEELWTEEVQKRLG